MVPAGYLCFSGCPYSIPPSSSPQHLGCRNRYGNPRKMREDGKATYEKNSDCCFVFGGFSTRRRGILLPAFRTPQLKIRCREQLQRCFLCFRRKLRTLFMRMLQSLRNSAFLNRLIALIPTPNEDPDYLEFVRSTGFDYTRDLDRVAIAIFPTTPLPTVVTFAEGRFDQQKIIAYALRTGKAERTRWPHCLCRAVQHSRR